MEAIESKQAPKAIGPYSQAIKANGFLFISGQLPIDPVSNEIVQGDIQTQTRQIMQNITAILGAAEQTCQDIVKTTILLTDIKDFTLVNETYSSFFAPPYPARAAYQVAALPKNASIEIEATAQITQVKP